MTTNERIDRIQRLWAFGRYLSWAELMKCAFMTEMERESAPNADAAHEHEWRSFGLMAHWYASLYVVVEAWESLGLSDSVVSQLLAHPAQLKDSLRRFRNAVFHYQDSLTDARFLELMNKEAVHVHWVWALHGEFARSLREALYAPFPTEALRSQIRAHTVALINWFPDADPPEVLALARTLSEGRDILRRHPGEDTEQRRDLLRALDAGEELIRSGRPGFDDLRKNILRAAGISVDEFPGEGRRDGDVIKRRVHIDP